MFDMDDDNLWRINLFEVLGVTEESSHDEIKKTYKKLAKKYHPDRFPANSPEQEEAKEKFADISQAYDVLTDERKRNQYLDTRRLLKDHLERDQGVPSAPPPTPKEKKQIHSEAEEYKKKQAKENMNGAKQAIRKNNLDEAITLIKQALELQPDNSEFHAQLGEAYNKKGWQGMAQAAYKQALVLDPKNLLAKKNYAGESKKKEESGFLGGLFSRFKKK